MGGENLNKLADALSDTNDKRARRSCCEPNLSFLAGLVDQAQPESVLHALSRLCNFARHLAENRILSYKNSVSGYAHAISIETPELQMKETPDGQRRITAINID